jgi:hypothetical protein
MGALTSEEVKEINDKVLYPAIFPYEANCLDLKAKPLKKETC